MTSGEDFLPASASSSKSRKSAQKQSQSSWKPSTSTKKAKAAGGPTLLPTQPSNQSIENDEIMTEFSRREPLYDSSEYTTTKKNTSHDHSEQAQDAIKMNIDSDHDDDNDEEDEQVMIDPASLPVPVTRTPISSIPGSNELSFPAVNHITKGGLTQRRKIGIPPHRMTPLKRDWLKIYTPLVEELGLQVRMNLGKKWIEMKTSKHTPSTSSLTRASDFLSAYALGFAVEDAIALLRLEELYVESFEIKDVKTLHGDHLSRAIGRIAGHEGKTRFVIENASRTRIVLADTKIHILGRFNDIKIARDAICALILGAPSGKIYSGLRRVASRSRERF